jgi:hypothetical protein
VKHSIWKKFRQLLDLCDEIGERLRLVQESVDQIPNVLKSELMIMAETLEEAVARNSQKVVDAISAAVTKEAGEIKALILAGDNAAAIAALDKLGDNAAAAATTGIDSVSDAATATNPSSGETGSGSSGEVGG